MENSTLLRSWLCPSPYSLVAGLVLPLTQQPGGCRDFIFQRPGIIVESRFRWSSSAPLLVTSFIPSPCLLSSHYNEVLNLYGSLMRCGGLDCCFTISVVGGMKTLKSESRRKSSRGDPQGSALFSLSTLAEF